MTALTTTGRASEPAGGAVRGLSPVRSTEDAGLSWPRLLHAEWLKFSTLRSTWAVLAAAIVTMLMFSLVFGYNSRDLTGLAPADAAPSAVLQGYYSAQLLLIALGVIFVSGEYATGSIGSTFAAVPRRLRVMTAKAVVLAVLVFLVMTATSVAAFLLGQGIIARYRDALSLTDSGVLRVIVGTAVYLTAITLIGSAIGWLLRSTPGALLTASALILVLPGLTSTVLGSAGQHVAAFLPVGAGAAFASSAPQPGSLVPWPGFAVLVGWMVALFAFAAIQLRRRDA